MDDLTAQIADGSSAGVFIQQLRVRKCLAESNFHPAFLGLNDHSALIPVEPGDVSLHAAELKWVALDVVLRARLVFAADSQSPAAAAVGETRESSILGFLVVASCRLLGSCFRRFLFRWGICGE